MSWTAADDAAFKALKRLAKSRPVRCVELGEALWTERRYADRQAWCRPAGRALHRLRRAGVASEVVWRYRKAPNQPLKSGWLPVIRGELQTPDGLSASRIDPEEA